MRLQRRSRDRNSTGPPSMSNGSVTDTGGARLKYGYAAIACAGAVKEVLDGGGTVTEVARRYGVTRQSLHNWLCCNSFETVEDVSHAEMSQWTPSPAAWRPSRSYPQLIDGSTEMGPGYSNPNSSRASVACPSRSAGAIRKARDCPSPRA